MTGCKPQVHVKFLPEDVPAATDRIREFSTARTEVQKLLEAIQKHKDACQTTEIKVGDQVWLEGRNLHVRGTCKLLLKQYGPFKIMEQIGAVAYRLQLPDSMKIYNVVHVDLLLPYKETEAYGPAYTRPPPDLIGEEEEYKVELIRDSRRKRQGRTHQYLMHWKGYPTSEDSWVNHKDLHTPKLLEEFLSQSTVAG